MFICNLALSFLGQDYVPSYTFSCCDQKCCVSILDRWLRLSLSLRSVVSDLSHAMDCSPPVSSVHGDFSDKNTGTGCHASPGESSQPRDQTHVSCVSCLSVQFSRSVVSDSLRLHESQHARPPCPSPTPRVHPNSTSIESVMPSSHLILCCPLFLLPPIPPSIRVFSNESTLRMRWPKYWSFSFSIIPSKEQPGLISFRMD